VAAYDRGYARRRPGQYGDEEINHTQPVGAPVPMEPIAPPAALVEPPPPVTPPAAAPPAAPRPLSGGGGIANQGSFTGFDFNREQDRSKSAKDTFAYYGGANAGGNAWATKDGAEDWFNQFIRPGLEDEGYKVGEVVGDTAFVHTRENPEGTWIDFVRGADGDDPALQWLDQSYMDDAPAGGAGGAGALAGMPGGSAVLDGLTSEGGLNDGSDLMAQIQAALQKLLQGDDPGSPNAPVAL
jgi:hypothetical protein